MGAACATMGVRAIPPAPKEDNMFVVVRLGRYCFPCGVSTHATHSEAIAAAESHAKEHGVTVRSTEGNKPYQQLLTGDESYRSYVIIEEGAPDNPDHDFRDA